MSKVLVLNGSPRKKGNTVYLIGGLSKELIEKGHEVEVLYLNDLDIKPCQGCFWCYRGFPLRCVQDDAMNSLYPMVLGSYALVFASPIYWFNYSAQLKLFVDRLVALHVEGGHALDGIKFASVFVYGDRDSEASGVFTAMESVERMVSYFKGVYLGVIHGTGGDDLTVSENKMLLRELEKLADKI
jgi:multimeric flavodoxin WrbA